MDKPLLEHVRLRRVLIGGYRSIRRAEVELGDVTVLIGANGAGKSNFLGFLQMLRYLANERLSLYVNERRGANALLHFGSERTSVLYGQIEVQSDAVRGTYSFRLGAAEGDRLAMKEEFTTFGAGNSATGMLPIQGEESVLARIAVNPNESHHWDSALFVAALACLDTLHFHHTGIGAPIRGFQNLREDRFLLPNGGNLAVILYVLRLRHPAHYARIVDEMRQVLPEFLDFVLEPSAIRGDEQIELRWKSRNSTATMGPDQMSDGSLRAAALITLLLQPAEMGQSIVVIDEPELGLHPQAVGQIGRLVSEAAVHRQVIVSTQSPQFLSQFDPEQVVVVESENGESTFRHLSRDDLASWLNEFDNDLGRLFEMNITGGAPR